MDLLSGHRTQVCMDNTKVLAWEQNWCKRKVKEAIRIKQRAIVMNWNKGNHLPAISNQSIPSESESHVIGVQSTANNFLCRVCRQVDMSHISNML